MIVQSPVAWAFNANGSRKYHSFSVADHQMVFASTEVISDAVEQTAVHSPLRNIWFYRSPGIVNAVDVYSLLPVI